MPGTGPLQPGERLDAGGIAGHFRTVPLLSVLDDRDLDELAARALQREYPRGEPVFLQGEVGEEFFLIVRGSVQILTVTPEGREVTLAVLDAGSFFGEMALIDGEPRSASAIAASPCHVLVLRRPEFLKVLEVAESARKLLAFLSMRLRTANSRMQDMALLTVRQRLAALLADLAIREGAPDGPGLLLPPTVNHRTLAAMLSTNRESVSRETAALRSRGLVEQVGRRLRVLDPGGLRALVERRE